MKSFQLDEKENIDFLKDLSLFLSLNNMHKSMAEIYNDLLGIQTEEGIYDYLEDYADIEDKGFLLLLDYCNLKTK